MEVGSFAEYCSSMARLSNRQASMIDYGAKAVDDDEDQMFPRRSTAPEVYYAMARPA
jgi:hypothetical protein